MTNYAAGALPVVRPQSRLSSEERAWIMAVAEQELAQGRISFEEYHYLQDHCRVRPWAALIQRIVRMSGRGGLARFPFGRPGDPHLYTLQPRLATIAVRSIVGSVNRAEHLDRRFRPIHGGRARLESIRQALAAGTAFLPIEVYRLDGACYVIDGHHRVGAALQVGQLYLDALVTECRRTTE